MEGWSGENEKRRQTIIDLPEGESDGWRRYVSLELR
jgi:hypothetical protein